MTLIRNVLVLIINLVKSDLADNIISKEPNLTGIEFVYPDYPSPYSHFANVSNRRKPTRSKGPSWTTAGRKATTSSSVFRPGSSRKRWRARTKPGPKVTQLALGGMIGRRFFFKCTFAILV